MTQCSRRVVLWLIFLTLLCNPTAVAQTDEELRREVETLKEGQKTIQKELEEIKQLLGARRVPKEIPFKEIVIDVADAPFKGAEAAKHAIIEFSDYQ